MNRIDFEHDWSIDPDDVVWMDGEPIAVISESELEEDHPPSREFLRRCAGENVLERLARCRT